MPNCGSQVILCDLPIRFDTYVGCTHGCQYCFATKKINGFYNKIKKGESLNKLKSFIEGKRTQETNWCDWDIPLHIGGLSDPLQPIEKEKRYTYECLKLLKETQYPFVLSTKGKLLGDDEYLDILSECNCVIQVSMVCSSYDEIEKGCPTFEERLEIVNKVAPKVKRVIIRIQPYMREFKDEIISNLKKLKEAGAYGVIVEGMKWNKKHDGLIKVGGDFTYPLEDIKNDLIQIKTECHKLGLRFFSGENRTRTLGDNLCCCGIENLKGFKGNDFNLNHIINGEKPIPTEKMKQKGTARSFSSLYQNTVDGKRLKKESFVGETINIGKNKREFIAEIFGKKK